MALAGAFARRAFALVVAAALAGGFAASGGQASLRLAESLPVALEGRDIVVTGVVASLPQQGPSGLRFRFAVDGDGAPAGAPELLALGWYAGFHEDAALVQPRQALRAGQRWRFTVRLRQLHGNLNPNGFDYELAPLALAGTALAPLWWLAALIVQGLDALLARLAALPGAVWTVAVAPWWAQLAGLLAAVVIVLPLPWRAKLIAIPLALALLVPASTLPPEGGFDVVAADVGQGTAVLVRTRRHVLLFDSGSQYSLESDAGQRVLVPLLRSRGEGRLDLLVLSHRDSDHVGGAGTVLRAVAVDSLSSSLEDGHPLLAAARNPHRCVAGQRWRWDGVDFEILRPEADDYGRALRSNAMSCVLRVAGGGHSLLLTGDIEREQEAALVASHGPALQSDVLVVPHHGSKTSSSAAFLDAVRPRAAIFQAGYRNRFGHPAGEVLERYRERGIAIVASPACGVWQWRAVGAPEGSCERVVSRRYWQHREQAPAR